MLAVHLNTLLGERPVQHREVQGNESDLFMSYFPRGLKYQVSLPCGFSRSPVLPAGPHPAEGPVSSGRGLSVSRGMGCVGWGAEGAGPPPAH